MNNAINRDSLEYLTAVRRGEVRDHDTLMQLRRTQIPESLQQTIRLYAKTDGRVNGYNLSSIVESMDHRARTLLAHESHADIIRKNKQVDHAGQLILYKLLSDAGLASGAAAYAAYVFPDPDIFHPAKSTQAHQHANSLALHAKVEHPIDALFSVAKSAQSVKYGDEEYQRRLELIRPRLERYSSELPCARK